MDECEGEEDQYMVGRGLRSSHECLMSLLRMKRRKRRS